MKTLRQPVDLTTAPVTQEQDQDQLERLTIKTPTTVFDLGVQQRSITFPSPFPPRVGRQMLQALFQIMGD